MTRLAAAAFALLLSLTALPAHAQVVITFWSHEFGNHFPHAFFTLRGTPEAGGEAVDLNYGFTPKAVTPAILFGPVAGRIDIAKRSYMEGSDAQFLLVLTDAQYASILKLVDEWDDKKGDGTYRMNTRNCVHFTQEAARRAGLVSLDFPDLMKKPRSFLKAVAKANAAQVTLIDRHGKEYLAALDAQSPAAPATALPTVAAPAAATAVTTPPPAPAPVS
ncbi:hypothetical protein [Sphingomonas sp.]|jgi:hypothetical protein|uniref:hypothetical protein n=1 Tax=Sphingomonas sp. TaxID=28214 RepID=UPI0026051090|nr:hypothetical protein [Sphingomonas sp.]MDF2494301.1 hypothetical protein [Sphingomonas sp.]